MFDGANNPFADPTAKSVNPFADPAVQRATASTPSATTKVEQYNPFAGGQRQTEVRNDRLSSVDLSPSSSSSLSSASRLSSVSSDVLQQQQKHLERSAERLDDNRTNPQPHYIPSRIDNFPPLPSFCPCKPCFYQDFDVDIPSNCRRLVKIGFYFYIAYTFVLLINVFAAGAYFVVVSQAGDPGYAGLTFGLSFVHLALGMLCSFACWYRPLYKAFRSDNSLQFFWFFLISLVQFAVLVFACFGGLFENGYIGWFVVFRLISDKHHGVAIFMVVVACLFTGLAVAQFAILVAVIRLYRVSGASFQQAQQQFVSAVQQSTVTASTEQNRY